MGRGEVGVVGLSRRAGPRRCRIGRLRKAERGLSVGDEMELVGDGVHVSRLERAGDIGAVGEWETECIESTDPPSTLTTSHPSTDSDVVEDESDDDTKLALRLTVDVNAVLVGDCARNCSFSFSLPLSPPNNLFTPKLSLRFRGLWLAKGGAEKLLSLITSLSFPSAFVKESVMLLASAMGSLKNPDALGDSGDPGGLAGSGLRPFGFRMSSDFERDMPFPFADDGSR